MSHEKPQTDSVPSKEDRKAELEKITEAATDMDLVDFLSGHIDNPCKVEVSPGEIRNIRQFYLKVARDSLDKLSNPFARELLEKKIKEYETK